jgi:hypothetical protein
MRQVYLGVTVLVMACSGTEPTSFAEPEPAVASVTIKPLDWWLCVGSTYQLEVLLYDPSGRRTYQAISFTSSDLQVASVEATGLVRAMAVGGATLTATSEGKSGSIWIQVDTCSSAPYDYRSTP